MDQKIASIILAAGKGTRMGIHDKHKVTSKIAGIPAIIRLMDSIRKNGIIKNLIVIGVFRDQIINTITKKYKDIIFINQPEQKGTGNAAKYGINYLRKMNFEGDILISTGDAFIEHEFLSYFIQKFYQKGSDLAVLVKKKKDSPYSGRIFVNENLSVVASIEYWDIVKAILSKKILKIIENSEEMKINQNKIVQIEELLLKYLRSEDKIRKLLPDIFDTLKKFKESSEKSIRVQNNMISNIKNSVKLVSSGFSLNSKYVDAEYLEKTSKFVNVSLYLGKSSLFYCLIEKISKDNAQNEEYLTDIIQISSEAGYKVNMIPVKKSHNFLSFNNPEELDFINRYVKSFSDE
ncbi:MAG: NTP transferase domain-containing protein [archaeon]|nr:NTP transferase domain-containing protein [archaeon]